MGPLGMGPMSAGPMGMGPMSVGPMQYTNVVPLIVAAGAMVVLVLLCRWVFSTKDRDQRMALRLEKARSRGDFGLLVPVATVRGEEPARLLRVVLLQAGIRATVSAGQEPGQLVVLVFRADADRARSLVSS